MSCSLASDLQQLFQPLPRILDIDPYRFQVIGACRIPLAGAHYLDDATPVPDFNFTYHGICSHKNLVIP